MRITNYRRGGRRPADDTPEVVVWYRVKFVGGPLAGDSTWFPAPIHPYFQVPGPSGGVLSSQYQLVRKLLVEPWRAFAYYEFHWPSR